MDLLRWNHADGVLQFRIDRASPSGLVTIVVRDTQPSSAYLGAWHHVAATCDTVRGVARLYVDGVQRAETTGFSGPLEHTSELWLMGQPLGSHATVPGRADDVRVYGRALTRLEVQRLARW